MRISLQRVSRALAPGRHSALASLLLIAGMGVALMLGGCGGHNSQTSQNANNPGSSQTTGVQNGGPATGTSNGTGQNAGSPLQSLNNSINSSVSSLNNDQNDANSSASQSQEQEQQP